MKKAISITTPGSKSITNRVLVLAALSNRKTTIKNAANCDDTNYMVRALNKLGVKTVQKGSTITVHGRTNPTNTVKSKLFTGNAGTTTRFLAAFCTLLGRKIEIDGDKRMRERPIGELLKVLNTLGAKVTSKTGCPPFTVHPDKLIGGSCNLPGNISSQYLSAILLTTPFAQKDTIINIEQELYSKPYIEMTIKVLKDFGIKVLNKNFRQFVIRGNQKIKAIKSYTVESDASSASYIGAYAALNPEKDIKIENLSHKSIQGDIKFLDYLKKIGCKITYPAKTSDKTIYIKGPNKLKSLGMVDMNKTPDLVMTFAVLALFTPGKTKIINIANLRIKETDRIAALKNELSKLGAKVKEGKDFIEIESSTEFLEFVQFNRLKTVPQNKQKNKKKSHQKIQESAKIKVLINTYNDHRIAMAFGILRNILTNLKIQNPKCVSKSYTTFWEDLKQLEINTTHARSNTSTTTK